MSLETAYRRYHDLTGEPISAALLAICDSKSVQPLTVKQVAERLGVCPDTVYSLCDRGELPSHRVGRQIRVYPSDLNKYMGA